MLPTATGAIVILLGIWCQFGDYRRILVTLILLTLFEAADAADLIALGGASVTPAKLFLLFFVLRLVSMRDGTVALAAAIAPGRVLFIYLLLLIWVVASGVLLPRLFMGEVDVFSLERTIIDTGAVPLKPSTGNITQAVYAMGSFMIAVGTCVLARKPGGYATVLTALLWVTGLDLFFGVVDLVTSATHTGFLLDAIHTGAYAFLTSDESNGMKRISGTFSEASAFATFSLELLAINLSLLVSRVRPLLTGFYSVALVAFLALSTSSTAYVGLGVFGLGFGLAAVTALLRHGNARPLKVFAASLAVTLFLGGLVFLLAPKVAASVGDLLDVSLLQKSQSDSAIERGELNTQSMKIFLETYGMGSGIGSTRSSNYILVLASNLGVIGLALFALLIGALALARPRPDLTRLDRKVVAAARVGVLASLVPATLIGVIFDLGPLFYILVGIVASSSANGVPQPSPRADARLGCNGLGTLASR